MTTYYPVYLNLKGRRCVIIGGGTVAEGKIERLLDSGAEIRVVSPDATPGIRQCAADGTVRWEQRHYRPGDLDGAFIAIAATNQREVNRQIFEEAEERGVMLNAVDDPPNCSFIAPSILQRGPVTVAISTGGVSPALARRLRESLQASNDLAWADLSDVMSKARATLRQMGLLSTVDPQRWQCCINPELLTMAQRAGRRKRSKRCWPGSPAKTNKGSATTLLNARQAAAKYALPGRIPPPLRGARVRVSA